MLFERAPLVFCKYAYHHENHSVDFETIWATNEEQHKKWQRLYRSKFIALALKTYEHRTVHQLRGAGPNELRKASEPVFSYWKAVMSSEEVRSLELGAVGDTPSRPSKSAGDTRQSMLGTDVNMPIIGD